MKRILAVYRDQRRAAYAAKALEQSGFDPEAISILVADSASGQAFMAAERTAATKSAIAGAALGSTGGLVATSIAGVGAILTGPIGITVAGAVAGGLLGALVGLGIPENEAVMRSHELNDGAILVAVDFDEIGGDLERAAIRALGRTDYQQMLEVDKPAISKQTS